MEEQETRVRMSPTELQALIELGGLAQGRMTVAEKTYYDALLTRFSQDLALQLQAAADE